jgi:hypothetical protein
VAAAAGERFAEVDSLAKERLHVVENGRGLALADAAQLGGAAFRERVRIFV